jgi:hypothetical protein
MNLAKATTNGRRADVMTTVSEVSAEQIGYGTLWHLIR